VLADVLASYVSVAAAERDYGVVVREHDGRYELDRAATEAARAARVRSEGVSA
jgi:hypothetical protein